jgi:hypothetical protein
LTVTYKQVRNPNAISYVKQADSPLSLKITYKGQADAPKSIQVKITYTISRSPGSFRFDGAVASEGITYKLDSVLEAFLDRLFLDETDMLPKDFDPVRPLTVHDIVVTVIPSLVTTDASGKITTVATGDPKGFETSNKLCLVLKQVLGSQGAGPPTKAPSGAAPKAAP